MSILAAIALTILPNADEMTDVDYGISFEPDRTVFQPAAIPVAVLGEPIAVMTTGRPPEAVFVTFVRSTPKGGRGDGASAEDSVKAVSVKLGMIAASMNGKAVVNENTTVDGRPALNFRIKGPGAGLSLGQGDTTTLQHWTAVPRGNDLIVFQLTAAEDNFKSAYEAFEKAVTSAKIEADRPAEDASRKMTSDEMELDFARPGGGDWIRGGYELGDWIVPGYNLRTWSAPLKTGKTQDGESEYAVRLSALLQFPGREMTVEELTPLVKSQLGSVPGTEVVADEPTTVDGRPAMRVTVEGNSNHGAVLNGQGDIRVRQTWVAVPRVTNGLPNLFVTILNTPVEDAESRTNHFDEWLKTVELD